MQADIEKPDCILFGNDIAFNFTLTILRTLRETDDFKVDTYNTVTIDNIESNDKDDFCRFKFGGNSPAGWIQCFAKTTSSVLRLMMLRSVNNEGWCPKFGKYSEDRNRRKLRYDEYGNKFTLASSKEIAREYYSCYDQLHTHFKIEHQFKEAYAQGAVTAVAWHLYMPSTMMLIFRRNFTEVIEIGTTLSAGQMQFMPLPHAGQRQYMPPGFVKSSAHVYCIVRRISNPNHDVLKFLRALKATNGYQHECEALVSLLQKLIPQLPAIQVDDDDDQDELEEYNWIASPPSVPRPRPPLPVATTPPKPIPGSVEKLPIAVSPFPANAVQDLGNKFAGLDVDN